MIEYKIRECEWNGYTWKFTDDSEWIDVTKKEFDELIKLNFGGWLG